LEVVEVKNEKETRALEVVWDDGKRYTLQWALLRGYCPCAHCQGHGAGPKRFVTPPEDLTLVGIKAVGRYALQLSWSDRHTTGLYTFEYLRQLGEAQ
jgi:DUF971 family protein